MKIVQVTEVLEDRVEYRVEVDGEAVWAKVVPFGKAKAFRAGCSAFVEAAHDQAVVAAKLVRRASLEKVEEEEEEEEEDL